MTSKAEWLALAKRCENATGSDRELDTLIGVAINLHPDGAFPLRETVPLYKTSAEFAADNAERYTSIWRTALPRYTASLDAITALIERDLPGWMIRVQWCGVSAEAWVAPDLNDGGCPQIYRDNAERWHDYAERNEVEIRPGSREAAIRALCAAFCRAMSEKAA